MPRDTIERRLAALEAKDVGGQPETVMRWVWRDGRAHNAETGESMTAEERAAAYEGQNVFFIDIISVPARNGRPYGLASNGRPAEECKGNVGQSTGRAK